MEIHVDNTFPERLKVLITKEKLSQKNFAKKISTAERNVSTAVLGKSLPSYGFLEGILKAYEQLNARWLLTGEGSMWCDDQIDTADDDTDTVRLNAISQPSSVILDKAKNEQVPSEAAAAYATKSDKDTKIATLQKEITDKVQIIDGLNGQIKLLQELLSVYKEKGGSTGETQLQSKAS